MLIYGIVWGTSRAATCTLKYDETCNLLCFLCTNDFRKFPVRSYLPLSELRFFSGCFGSTAKKPSLELFHGAFFWFFSRLNFPRHIFFLQLHIFMFFFSNSTFRFAILSFLNPVETFHFVFRYVSLTFGSPNNLINARA